MKHFKITVTDVTYPDAEVESWNACVEELPGSEVYDARTEESAVRIVKAKVLRWLATLVESGEIEIEKFELSQCCHEPTPDAKGYIHCRVCGEAVAVSK